jgi:oxygen-independent coproporphyrinogen-3 oxidase
VRTPDRYIATIEAGRSPEAAREELTDGQRQFEALSLSLRTPRGVPWVCLEQPDELEGLITRVDDRAVLTVRGRLLANEVSTRIGSGILHR